MIVATAVEQTGRWQRIVTRGMLSSYNFTNSRVATHFHAWLHAKSCRVPRLVAACPTPRPRMVTRKELPCATLSSCVSHATSTRGYTQKASVCHD